VGPVGGPTVERERRRILFVTGKLAEPALREVLREMDPRFEARVAVLKITVAALMTTSWIPSSSRFPKALISSLSRGCARAIPP